MESKEKVSDRQSKLPEPKNTESAWEKLVLPLPNGHSRVIARKRPKNDKKG